MAFVSAALNFTCNILLPSGGRSSSYTPMPATRARTRQPTFSSTTAHTHHPRLPAYTFLRFLTLRWAVPFYRNYTYIPFEHSNVLPALFTGDAYCGVRVPHAALAFRSIYLPPPLQNCTRAATHTPTHHTPRTRATPHHTTLHTAHPSLPGHRAIPLRQHARAAGFMDILTLALTRLCCVP